MLWLSKTQYSSQTTTSVNFDSSLIWYIPSDSDFVVVFGADPALTIQTQILNENFYVGYTFEENLFPYVFGGNQRNHDLSNA